MPLSLRSAARSARVLALVVLGLASAGCVIPKRPLLREPSRELLVPGEGHHLTYGNGLTLLVVPDTQTHVIQLDVRHHVGQRDDPAGKAQMAHFVEHLMFELPSAGPGSPTLGVEARDRSIHVNAYTSPDETHYLVTGQPSELETHLRHAARRLAFDCSELDDATLARVREIVQNEIRQRREGVDAQLRARVVDVVFPADHPYRERIHVEHDELATITREELCAFIERHYVPARTTVVVTGNVTPEAVQALTDPHLGQLPAVEVEQRAPVPAVEPSTRRVTLEAPVGQASGVVLFPIPTRFSAEHIPADVAIEAVRVAAILAKNKEDSAIEDWDLGWYGGKQAPVLAIQISVDRPERLDDAIDTLLDEIYAVFARELSTKTFDRVRQLRRLRLIEDVASIAGRSRAYAEYLEEGDAPSFVVGELAAIDALTPERVRRVGRSVFSPDRAITVAIVPAKASAGEQSVDRVELVAEPAPEPFVGDASARLPEDIDPADAHRDIDITGMVPPELRGHIHTLANGMQIVLVPSSEFPIMEARIVYGAGLLHASDQPLVAALADSVYGPRDADALALVEFVRLAGGQFGGDVGLASTQFRVRGLSIYLDFLIAGLAEAYAHGTYSENAFVRQKAAVIKLVENERTELLLGPVQAYLSALYGEGHPYVGSLGDVASLRSGQVRRFHRTHYRASNATLVITGGFDMELALEHARGAFESPRDVPSYASWNVPRERSEVEVPPIQPRGNRLITRVFEAKTQTQVFMGYGLDEAFGRGHASLLVLTEMLEHELESVRETLGASYGVHAALYLDWPRIEIRGDVDSRRAGEALAEVRAAIGRVFEPTSFDRRFVAARRKVLRSLLGVMGDPQSHGELVAIALRHGRPVGYFRSVAHSVAKLHADDLRSKHESWLVPDGAVTFIQGPATGVEAATKELGLTDVRVLEPVLRAKD